ncbi:conserved unknown protein [Ectocarpus siliculosus]|uniref:S1 motif domain-containing protein n=1 Tax=Ectocarpus siliculosus TaxID=2880 RepID=D7FU45_ECTSI|nr:conserved unknown protein [Ectocarpus siliculosus]|eukprot:CBJ31572.1 conserved unknown protein [Ectocarpus siliculosus]
MTTDLRPRFVLSLCLLLDPCGSFLHSSRGVGCLPCPRLVQRSPLPRGQRLSATMSSVPAVGQKKAKREPPRLLENLEVGERLKGVVVTELDGTSGKKAWVRVGVMRRAKGGKFSHVDGMIRLNKEKGLKPKKVAVDKPVTVYVSKVIEAEGRLEVSLRAPKPLAPIVDTSTLKPLADLKHGEELTGVVKTVTQFAAFVQCGVGRPTRRKRRDGKPMVMEEVDGFLGKDDVPEDAALSAQLVKTQDQTNIISEGDRVKVFVKETFPGNGRFHVTLDPNVSAEDLRRMKNEVQKKKSKFARRKETGDLVEGEEILGGIVRVLEFGFFVDVGAKANGLVHISSISEKENRYLDNLNEFASVGDKMYVRVNGVDEEGRLSLAYAAREKDRPKPPNRRERRRAARGDQGAAENKGDEGTQEEEEDDKDGGFLFEPSSAGSGGSVDDDEEAEFDIFEDM